MTIVCVKPLRELKVLLHPAQPFGVLLLHLDHPEEEGVYQGL
jgi:hypothetical protein